jgi:hypothetical protein
MTRLRIIDRKCDSGDRALSILLVHGACMGAWCWEEHFLRYFSEHGYHAVALDLRGHGGSAGRERLQTTTINDYVDDVYEVASQLNCAPVVIGHSMGGLIAQRFLAQHLASGVVLLAPSPVRGMGSYGWRLVMAYPWPFLKAILSRDAHRLYPDDRHVRALMFSHRTPEATVTQCRQRLQPESWYACREMSTSVKPISNPKCPMLVLGGELDGTVPVKAIRETASAYEATMQIFPDAGHNLMLEPSWKDVANCIHEWISTTVQPNIRLQTDGPQW